MDKQSKDEAGEIFQDDLTENQSKAVGAVRDDAEHDLKLDSEVDSQEDDEAMAQNRFGRNETR